MSTDVNVQRNGSYLRIILPDVDVDWTGVWIAVDFEMEDGIDRVKIIAPCYRDDASLDGVRRLVGLLEQRGIDALVEWQGIPEGELVTVGGP